MTGPGGTLAHRESAKSGQNHGTTFLKRTLNGIQNRGHGFTRGNFGQIGCLGNGINEFGFIHKALPLRCCALLGLKVTLRGE
jgi:hypothetical protein